LRSLLVTSEVAKAEALNELVSR
jgi:hypothetical protein